MKLDETIKQTIWREVESLLGADTSGHGMSHVKRVVQLAGDFALQEGADKSLVWLAATLHDVDDYKLFGAENAAALPNAARILATIKAPEEVVHSVSDIIRTMGYSRSLEGIRPQTIEGQIVSDADMCDAIGAIGILRTHAFSLSRRSEFFDPSLPPIEREVSREAYQSSTKSHSVQHFFDKLLRIPSLLMTKAGQAEGRKRQAIMAAFLQELFSEEGASDWQDYLEAFLASS